VRNKTVNAPIAFAEIVMVMIKCIMDFPFEKDSSQYNYENP